MTANSNLPPRTQAYGDPQSAKVLLIGHDPRLQKSDTIAQYALYADYYFRFPARPKYGPDAKKYGLAKQTFDYAAWLTAGRYTAQQALVTNLCNEALPHAPGGGTVCIPEPKARDGTAAIRGLLAQGQVDVIFAMSQQVTYWLMALGFCEADAAYLRAAAPRAAGAAHDPPFYAPVKQGMFHLVCGRRFAADGRWTVIPIPHVKNFPLRGGFAAKYGAALDAVRRSFGG